MRLSEAIREGSKTTQQAFGEWRQGDGTACALEAAAIALGTNHWNLADRADVDLPALCPEGCGLDEINTAFGPSAVPVQRLAIWPITVHLNDHHRWTREAIADWVQAQEAIHGIGQPENVDFGEVNGKTLTPELAAV